MRGIVKKNYVRCRGWNEISNIRDKTGIRYGRLIVKEIANTKWEGYSWVTYWKCQCDCGKETIVRANHLQRCCTKSCGCLHKDISIEQGEKSTGKNNPRYIDGEHCGKYTKEILKLKEKIRKRDNYACQECGMTQGEHKKKYNRILHVHHIDGNDANNVEENMTTLCYKCHRKK